MVVMVNNYILVISAAVLTPITNIYAKYYEVTEKGSLKTAGTWRDVLGEEDAKKIYQHMEVHLAYTLGHATFNAINDDFIPIVVALSVRIMALIQGTSYLSCVIYYKREYGGFAPEHCRNLAAHLLIFSNLGTRELTEKLSSLSEYPLSLYSLQNDSNDINLFSRSFLQPHVRQTSHKPKTVGSELSFSLNDKLYRDIMYNQIFLGAALAVYEDVLLKIICGNFGFQRTKYLNYPRSIHYEMPFWQKSISINENLES